MEKSDYLTMSEKKPKICLLVWEVIFYYFSFFLNLYLLFLFDLRPYILY